MARIKTIIIFLGDILILYGALLLTLIIRYGWDNFRNHLDAHLIPFSLIFAVWLLIFYLFDFYQIRALKAGFEFFRNLLTAVLVAVFISIALFYLFTPLFKLTPKTNLFIFSLIFSALDLGWRFLIIKFFMPRYARRRLLVIGRSKSIEEIISYIKDNPQIGYDLALQIEEDSNKINPTLLKQSIAQRKIDTLIISSYLLKKDLPIIKLVYQLLPLKIEVFDSIDFFEMIFQKIPLDDLDETWFIKEVTIRRRFYDAAKRVIDVILSFIVGILLLPLALLIAILIKITSPGDAMYKQKRMGKNGKPFVLYKFRTMRADNQGPLWTAPGDKRITPLGKFLRSTHLDEMPQLWNIFKGDISFIGPRAERMELAELYSELPHYEMRHIIKPGLTGWAQLNYRASASVEEANEKLKYDIYYIKNRSLLLDILIILKTAKLLFSNPE